MGEIGMVERVARAICVVERMNEDDALGGWLHWQVAARAAIETMREPTSAMIAAGANALLPDSDLATLPAVLMAPVWPAMIGAALQETDTK